MTPKRRRSRRCGAPSSPRPMVAREVREACPEWVECPEAREACPIWATSAAERRPTRATPRDPRSMRSTKMANATAVYYGKVSHGELLCYANSRVTLTPFCFDMTLSLFVECGFPLRFDLIFLLLIQLNIA